MYFYFVSDKYITYLRQFDKFVPLNKDETRPYVGIVLEIDGVKYYAPLTSPKPKHKFLKNGKDFRKIAGGMYGAINFNNMIPIPQTELEPIVFKKVENENYRRLLQNQYECILKDWQMITRTACSLRNLVLSSDDNLTPYDKIIKARCCNLLLEQKCKEFK